MLTQQEYGSEDESGSVAKSQNYKV